MATTLIENIVNELTMVVVQSVMKEFQAQEMQLAALEAKTFKKLDDLQAEVQSLRDCNAVNLQAMKTQQEKINNLENILARLEVTSLSRTQVESIVDNAFREIDIDYKIECAIEDCDFSDTVRDTVESELEYKGFLDEEDLQRYLDHHRFITEGSLIEFFANRVRVTVE